MSLPDALAQLVREAGGNALLLDARHARGLITDSARVEGLCKNLRNAGFARLIDFTAEHIGGAEFWMLLTLRHPGYGHAALTLKWKWVEREGLGTRDEELENMGSGESYSPRASGGQSREEASRLPDVPDGEPQVPDFSPRTPDKDTDKLSVLPDAPGDTIARGAGQPGGEPLQAGPVVHPSLSAIWPAAGLAEREIFEMFGIPFAGNENLAPLLLDEQFQGFPLRRDYAIPPRESYAARLLRERHERALVDSLVGRASLPAEQGWRPGTAAPPEPAAPPPQPPAPPGGPA